MPTPTLKVILILPSRYDEDGYVLRFWRGVLPSNTLCCLKTLTEDVAASGELGDAEIEVEIYDDSVQRIPIQRIARESRKREGSVLVGLVGVQSNQFPRATELALELRARDVPVMIGGFHVSGVLALFDQPRPELEPLLENGVTLVRGEIEGPGVLAGILADALRGEMKPIYSITEPPDICEARIPQPDPKYLRHFVSRGMGTIDTSRGCPFNCSFCTIISVQGRTMRERSPAAMLRSIERNLDNGIDFYFFTDDNLARSSVWEELFDGLIELRARGKDIQFMMQVDTQAWRLKRFVAKAKAAGCYLVFIGMESLNEKNLIAKGKRQNKTNQFAEMVAKWHEAGILVHVGYIIGLPHDTAESVRSDIAALKDEIQVDEASFFMLTPLPGSQDHLEMVRAGVPLDADLGNYDSFHETFRHPNFEPGEWRATYDEAWDTFYSKENIIHILERRPAALYWKAFFLCAWNRYSALQRLHPMVAGLLRRKERSSRRPLFAKEGLLRYFWRRTRDTARLAGVFGQLFFEFQEIWLLTRKKEDPRWSTLADLRARWVEAQRRIAAIDLTESYDAAARELRSMLLTSSERLRQLSGAGRAVGRRVRRKLRQQARDIERFLEDFELQKPSRSSVVRAQQYVRESLLQRYEDLTIRYVAKRRKANALRHELLTRLENGHFFTGKMYAVPGLVLFETVVGLRFGFAFLFKR